MSNLMIKKRANKAPELYKTSGRSVSMNPGQWQLEVLKDVRSKHPYVDLQGASLEFVDNKPEEMRAWGVIKVGQSAIIPFFIMPPRKASSPELADIDMIISKESGFRALNEGSYAEATISEQSGSQIDPNKQNYSGGAPGNNAYIGGATGDISPMESYNPGINQAAGFGKIGSCNVNELNLSKLDHILGSRPNLLGIARSYATTNIDRGQVRGPDVMFLRVVHDGGGGFSWRTSPMIEVSSNDGSSVQYIRPSALQNMLSPEQSKDVFSRLSSKGWAVIGGAPRRTSICIDELDIPTFPINQYGKYELFFAHSDNSRNDVKHALEELNYPNNKKEYKETMPVTVATVFSQIISLDGQTRPGCVAITQSGLYQDGTAFVGRQVDEHSHDHHYGFLADNRHQNHIDNDINMSDMVMNDVGCFIDTDSKMVTRPYKIVGHVQGGNGDTVIKLRPVASDDLKGGQVVYIVLNDWISTPSKMLPRECVEYGIDEGYWVPSSMAWSKIRTLKPALLEYGSTGGFMSQSAQASISKMAHGHYYIEGKDSAGNDLKTNIDSIDKLAFWTMSVGGSIDDLERFYNMEDGSAVSLIDINKGVQLKVASKAPTKRAHVLPQHQTMLKQAQEELADSMEAQAQTPGGAMPEKDTMADLLSLLSIGDDSVIEFIQNKEQIRTVEDGVGKILFSIRRGQSAGSEAAMSRALRSIGGIYSTIETIENDLRARGEIQ